MVLKRTIEVSDLELWNFCRAFETLRQRVPTKEMPGQLFCVFMFVAAAGGPVKCTQIEEGLGYNQSSVSRLTNWLYDKTRTGKPGLHWITKEYRGQDKIVILTPIGEQIAREFWETVYGQA
jgi:hypothetical protein